MSNFSRVFFTYGKEKFIIFSNLLKKFHKNAEKWSFLLEFEFFSLSFWILEFFCLKFFGGCTKKSPQYILRLSSMLLRLTSVCHQSFHSSPDAVRRRSSIKFALDECAGWETQQHLFVQRRRVWPDICLSHHQLTFFRWRPPIGKAQGRIFLWIYGRDFSV